jgi:glyoxylase I family protein
MKDVHVALTVSDLPRSVAWYKDLFDAQTIFSGPDDVSEVEILMLPGERMLALRHHSDTDPSDRFNYRRVGLDHLALHCDNSQELDSWRQRLEEKGVQYSEVQESPFGYHLNLKDPDGIALELFCAKTQG